MGKRASTPNGHTQREVRASRRKFLKTGVGLVGGASALPWLASDAAEAQPGDHSLEQLKRARKDSRHRVLLRGGTIISMDPQVGNFARGDVLIEGKKISRSGRTSRPLHSASTLRT